MKKNSIFKGLFIAVILCAVIFSACDQGSDPQKTIVVTGIPSQYNGKIGDVALAQLSNDDVAMGIAAINGGTFTVDLLEGETLAPFTGSGNYMVYFLIFESITADTYLWMGAIMSKSITNETTTISFSEFIPMSSVQQAPLSVKDVLPGILKQYE